MPLNGNAPSQRHYRVPGTDYLECPKRRHWPDYLCAVSKRIRQTVRWESLRSGFFSDTLFQLDLAKTGKAIFTADILALEKTDGGHG